MSVKQIVYIGCTLSPWYRLIYHVSMMFVHGDRCELDIVPGCTDRESPFFDPLANVDDGSCPFIGEE